METIPTTLATAGNVFVPAYLVLQSKGYRVTRIDGDGTELWIAEGNGLRFVAEGTIELLGVMAVYEARGEMWPASAEDTDAFMKRFYPELG